MDLLPVSLLIHRNKSTTLAGSCTERTIFLFKNEVVTDLELSCKLYGIDRSVINFKADNDVKQNIGNHCKNQVWPN